MARFAKLRTKIIATRARAQARGSAADAVLSTLLRVVLGVFENIPVLIALALGVGLAFLVADPASVLWTAINNIKDEALKKFVTDHIYIVADWALLWFGCVSAPPAYRSTALFVTLAVCYVHSDKKVQWMLLLVGLLLRFIFVARGHAKRVILFVLIAVVGYLWWIGAWPFKEAAKSKRSVGGAGWITTSFNMKDGSTRLFFCDATKSRWCEVANATSCLGSNQECHAM